MTILLFGNVEKSRQRRSRHFAEPSGSQTCRSSRRSRSRTKKYAPRVKMAAALPVERRVLARLGWVGQTCDFFEHSLPLTMRGSFGAFIGSWSEIFNRPLGVNPTVVGGGWSVFKPREKFRL